MNIIMQPAISLDGFISLPNGDSYSWVNQEDEARYSKAVQQAGCLIVGRNTFDQYVDDFNARVGVVNFVCSNSPGEDTDTVKYVSGSPTDIIKHIEQYGFTELVVCGGGEINGMLAEAGLVDEIVISIQPAVLGSGIPLFGSFKPNMQLELVSTNEDIKGVVQNHYKVVH